MNNTNQIENFISITPEEVYKVRKEFFDRLESEWSRVPERIDNIMGQAKYYIPPEEIQEGVLHSSGERINDVEHGLLLRSFIIEGQRDRKTPNESPRTLRFFYSILQAGDWLRFGILIRGDQKAHELLSAKRQMDLERVWDRPADLVQRGPDGLLVEWRFVEPNFYHNFAIQERFVQVARHLHFRLGWAINRHLNGFDEEDNQSFSDMDGLDNGRASLFFPDNDDF